MEPCEYKPVSIVSESASPPIECDEAGGGTPPWSDTPTASIAKEIIQPPAIAPGVLRAASALLEDAIPEAILTWALGEFGDRIAIATGFGPEGVALIDIASKVSRKTSAGLNVFFLDTGFLFPETYRLRDQIERRYGLRIRAYRTSLTPDLQNQHYGSNLWLRDPDLCCRLRKIEPLKDALAGVSVWVTGIRRDQTPDRARAGVLEWDHRYQLVKLNPFASQTRGEVWEYIRRNGVPYNPLHDRGYPSIGCSHCTRATTEGEDERAGRWPGSDKTECGLNGGGSRIYNLRMEPRPLDVKPARRQKE